MPAWATAISAAETLFSLFGSKKSKPKSSYDSEIGRLLSDRIKDLFTGDITKSKAFGSNLSAIRDALSAQAGGARQRLTDTAATHGFMDSGSVVGGMQDIERGTTQAFAKSVTELVDSLSRRGEELALPFLAGQSGEAGNFGQLENQRRGQNFDLFSNAANSLGTYYSNMDASASNDIQTILAMLREKT